MDTIVVGVDGSDTAQAACQEAARIAAGLGAQLHLVTAVDSKPVVEAAGVGGDRFAYSNLDDAGLMLTRIAQTLPPELEATTSAVSGKPADVIVSEAERLEASMIVVGSVRMQGMKRVLGSVANDVSHKAPCSVYIAKTT